KAAAENSAVRIQNLVTATWFRSQLDFPRQRDCVRPALSLPDRRHDGIKTADLFRSSYRRAVVVTSFFGPSPIIHLPLDSRPPGFYPSLNRVRSSLPP